MVVVDKKFQEMIPPLSAEEKAQLEENLKQYGCRDSLVVWGGSVPPQDCPDCHSEHQVFTQADEQAFESFLWECEGCGYRLAGDSILLDGHNRLEICNRLGIEFETIEMAFDSREEAEDWIDKNQLGRRNLKPDAISLIRGRIYNRTKKARGAPAGNSNAEKQKGQNVPIVLTAEKLASEYGVNEKTIKRDGQFAQAVEALKPIVPGIEKLVQSGDAPSKQIVIDAAKATPEKQKAIETLISGGSTADIKAALVELAGPKQVVQASKEIRSERLAERRQERIDKIAEISTGNKPLEAPSRYPVLLCDPPWRYEHVETESRAIENQYPTMELDAICALPVRNITTNDAILFLWATSPKLEEAFKVLNAWGFAYRTCMVWDKLTIGMGYYARQQHELLLICTKGSIPTPTPANRPSSVYQEKKGAHSSKPEYFYTMIERMYEGLEKLEMFCRTPREGWHAWGNQS